jgi:membrane-bound inhibitor of C-type lysozyme
MSRTLILAIALGLALPAAHAAEAEKKPKTVKKTAAKPKAKTKELKPGKPLDVPGLDVVEEPNIQDTVTVEYHCELNNKITMYKNEKDDSHIALRWKNRLHRLDRVGTTTGATRFENKTFGLIWIGIPSKGILLDSKLNRQLANECKNPEQLAKQTKHQ